MKNSGFAVFFCKLRITFPYPSCYTCIMLFSWYANIEYIFNVMLCYIISTITKGLLNHIVSAVVAASILLVLRTHPYLCGRGETKSHPLYYLPTHVL